MPKKEKDPSQIRAGKKASRTRKEREGRYLKYLKREKRFSEGWDILSQKGYPDFFVFNIEKKSIEFHEVKPTKGKKKLSYDQRQFADAIMKIAKFPIYVIYYDDKTNKLLNRIKLTPENLDSHSIQP